MARLEGRDREPPRPGSRFQDVAGLLRAREQLQEQADVVPRQDGSPRILQAGFVVGLSASAVVLPDGLSRLSAQGALLTKESGEPQTLPEPTLLRYPPALFAQIPRSSWWPRNLAGPPGSP